MKDYLLKLVCPLVCFFIIFGCQRENYSINEIKVEIANIRSCESTKCKIIGQLKKGDKIIILSRNNEFTQIKYNNAKTKDSTAYIHNKLYDKQVKTKLNFNLEKAIKTTTSLIGLIITAVIIKEILQLLIKLLFYSYFSKRRKYTVSFTLKWRYVDEDDFYEEEKKDNIIISNPNMFVDNSVISNELKKEYDNKEGQRDRYSHSTFRTEKKPVYRTEEYTAWERKQVYENGNYKYKNVPITKTKQVFSHYEDIVIEDKHYIKVATIENFEKIISIKSDLFAKLVNKKAKKYQANEIKKY